MSSRTTLADLAREPGKAELIGGRVVQLMPTGHWPNLVAFRIARSLDDLVRATGRGEAYTDNMGFAVPGRVAGVLRYPATPDWAWRPGVRNDW